MDEAIAQMVSITSTTPDLAAQYLQVADGDVSQAVSLFFENGGAPLGDISTSASQAPTTSRVSGAGNAEDPINIEEGNISDDDDPEITGLQKTVAQPSAQQGTSTNLEDDEAMARRLQEEMYSGGDNEGLEGVRAPIARQNETLLGPGADYYGPSIPDAIEERMQAFQNRRGRRAPGIFNQQPTSRIWQEGGNDRQALAESTGGASESNDRANFLARLFSPNWSLMFNGSWDDARDEGKNEKKWLLVNIQNEKVFDCQVLNRDIWKNAGVEDTVRENFIFLQYSKDDPRADQYCQFYFHTSDVEDEYPHIAIVDPRTGEQVKLWSKKVPNVAEFLMQLHEFLDRYSLDTSARNPVAKRKSEAKKEKPLEMLTEEEQLERALQASMAGHEQGGLKVPDEDPDDLTRSIGDLKGKRIQEDDIPTDPMNVDENGGAAEQNAFALIPVNKPHVEPERGPSVTSIQFRYSGGRVVRRFDLSDQVQRIYEWLRAEPFEGKSDVEFELVPVRGTNLIDSRDKTIAEAGLKNATIMIEFLEA